jgi:transposase InsO family protein
MEAVWYADRARLRSLARARADYTVAELAEALGRSASWVKKWRRRLGRAPRDDEAVLHSRSRARTHPPPAVPAPVVERILAIRDQPPAHLQRTPGPKAILYFLQHDPELRGSGLPLPRSTATVWRVLRRHGRIARRRAQPAEPWDLPPPLTSWQLDFKDVSTVAAEPTGPTGKRQHAVEALNCVDCGTSLLVSAQVRADFTEETTLDAVAALLREHGLPAEVTVDRDPRFVGGPGTGDFPSPFRRFLACLGVAVQVTPPRRPDRNAFVERYHGTYDRECLRVHKPATLEQAREVTTAFREHYNGERPNQARSCGNRPPLTAFPALPPRPPVPAEVDPDAWLPLVDGRRYVRKVSPVGMAVVETQRYYVGRRLAGQRVALSVDARARALVVRHGGAVVRHLPLRGLRDAPVPFERFVDLMSQEARAQARRNRRAPAWA